MSKNDAPCGSCGATPTYIITLHGRPVPACLRHLNHWRTPAPDLCPCGHGDHLHDREAVPELCMVCGDSARCVLPPADGREVTP